MQDFRKRRSNSETVGLIARTLGALVLVAVAFVAVRGAFAMYGKFAAAAAARSNAEAQVQELEARHTTIAAEVDSLGSDRGVEAAVRERYGVARPGEGEIDIVRQATTTAPVAVDQGFWSRLWRMLFVW